MKYRHARKIVTTWSFFLIFAITLFLAAFFIRQNRKPPIRMAGVSALKCDILKKFTFSDANALKEWDEKVFKNKVVYKIEKDGGSSYVRALSDKAASALYYTIKLDVRNERPVMMWRWRVEKFPTKARTESLEAENEDDYAARLFVIFPAMFITNWKVLEYVWSETIPAGTIGTSPYSKNIRLIVLRKGFDKDEKWFSEERDIYADYVKLFDAPPDHNVGAIAFMTNTEHTGTSAEAMYADIQIGYKKGGFRKACH